MAFTRGNINTVDTLTRDGSTVSVNTPSFEVFSTTSGPSKFNLGTNWTLESISGGSPSLTFKHNNVELLKLTDNGIENLVQPKLSVTNLSSTPATTGYANGDIVKVNNALYVLAP